jgi:hypothetical protein
MAELDQPALRHDGLIQRVDQIALGQNPSIAGIGVSVGALIARVQIHQHRVLVVADRVASMRSFPRSIPGW